MIWFKFCCMVILGFAALVGMVACTKCGLCNGRSATKGTRDSPGNLFVLRDSTWVCCKWQCASFALSLVAVVASKLNHGHERSLLHCASVRRHVATSLGCCCPSSAATASAVTALAMLLHVVLYGANVMLHMVIHKLKFDCSFHLVDAQATWLRASLR
jgi:hypothetical protein